MGHLWLLISVLAHFTHFYLLFVILNVTWVPDLKQSNPAPPDSESCDSVCVTELPAMSPRPPPLALLRFSLTPHGICGYRILSTNAAALLALLSPSANKQKTRVFAAILR